MCDNAAKACDQYQLLFAVSVSTEIASQEVTWPLVEEKIRTRGQAKKPLVSSLGVHESSTPYQGSIQACKMFKIRMRRGEEDKEGGKDILEEVIWTN